MIRACERCEAATRRPRYCSDRCSATARQRRSRAKHIAMPAPLIDASFTDITVRLTHSTTEDAWEARPDIQDAFDDEIRWKLQMRNASWRTRRPILRIDRPDIAALDDDANEVNEE